MTKSYCNSWEEPEVGYQPIMGLTHAQFYAAEAWKGNRGVHEVRSGELANGDGEPTDEKIAEREEDL